MWAICDLSLFFLVFVNYYIVSASASAVNIVPVIAGGIAVNALDLRRMNAAIHSDHGLTAWAQTRSVLTGLWGINHKDVGERIYTHKTIAEL